MRASTRTWRAFPWPGALLALVAWGLLAPGVAQAGCRHPGVSAGSASLLDGLDRLMANNVAPLPKPAPLPAPCRGPSCSEREAPPTAPAPTTHDLGQRWALGAIPTADAEAGSEAFPGADSRPRPVHHPLAIFHPPRSPRALATA